MSKQAHVIDGEASESDPEDVQQAEIASNDIVTKPHVIPGEAPESDEDDLPLYNRSLQLGKSSDEDSFAQDSPYRSSHSIYNSLLHQKLNDSNINLRISIERLLRNQNLLNKLTESEKLLLNDQELLRSASANINISLVKLKDVKNTLDKIASGNHLSKVKQLNRDA